MPRMRGAARPIVGTSIPLRPNFLMNAEIKEENRWDPE